MNEVVEILEVLKYAYPNFYKGMPQKEIEGIIKLWAMMFEKEDPKIVIEAVKAMITTLKFPPTIADIKEKVTLLTKEDSMSEMEAWGIIYKAICNSGYNSIENFEKLPSILQKVVGSAKQLKDWALTEDLNMQVVQSNFMRSYKVVKERKELIERLPASCKNIIEKGVEQLCLDALNAKEKVI